MLTLASIRLKKDQTQKNVEDLPTKKQEAMMSLLLGENLPQTIMNKISKKVNKNMYKEEFMNYTGQQNVVIAGQEKDNIFAKFAQEIKDKRTFFEL